MRHDLTLKYTLGEGWLKPWVDGLREGRAVASTCGACDLAMFPPTRTCQRCGAPSNGWKNLPGAASLLFRTNGSDGDFALARFDGAIGSAVVRSEALPENAIRGRLRSVPDGPPALILEPEAQI